MRTTLVFSVEVPEGCGVDANQYAEAVLQDLDGYNAVLEDILDEEENNG